MIKGRADMREEVAKAADEAAWKHIGSDPYSCGMDNGARHQVVKCVEAIRNLP